MYFFEDKKIAKPQEIQGIQLYTTDAGNGTRTLVRMEKTA